MHTYIHTYIYIHIYIYIYIYIRQTYTSNRNSRMELKLSKQTFLDVAGLVDSSEKSLKTELRIVECLGGHEIQNSATSSAQVPSAISVHVLFKRGINDGCRN
jgi:hypothetical protein